MKKVKRMLAWVVALILVLSPVGINPIYVNADGPVGEAGKILFDINDGGEVKYSSDGIHWDNVTNEQKVELASSVTKVYLKAEPDVGNNKILDEHTDQQYYSCNGDRTNIDRDTLEQGTYFFAYDSTKAYVVRIRFDNGSSGGSGESNPMDGFPAPGEFGSETLVVNVQDRVDVDNEHNMDSEDNYATGDFSVEKLPADARTLAKMFAKYNTITFKAKIADAYSGCKVSAIQYGFEVAIPGGDEVGKLTFRQDYSSPLELNKDAIVGFTLKITDCLDPERMMLMLPPDVTYAEIKDCTITSITADFLLNEKGSFSYIDPVTSGISVNTSGDYLNIVIPKMKVNGIYATWGGWNDIKAIYNVEENQGTDFTTYSSLFEHYKGIKIKVDISNIDPQFNKANEIFFYLHDPLDTKNDETVENHVKYDITNAHSQKQYVKKDGGIQEFTFDFDDTYYMNGSSKPDIWLVMGVESRPIEGEERWDVHYCDIKPVIENSNGTISLGDDCEKMQFNTASDTLMDVETATKISLNVSDEASVLSAIGGTETPSDPKQADLKSLIESNENMGTDESATEQVKQVMEINLSVGGTEIQPRGNNVKVSIPVSKFGDVNTQKLRLYHHVGGELVEITNVEVKDGMVSFDTPSFSYFVVVEDSSIPDAPEEDDKDDSKDDSSDKTETVSTVTATESVVGISTSNAGGYGRELASPMLIGDINATAAGSTLVVDRRYNRQYLSNAEMKALLNKGTVTLCMQYNYNGVEYITTIPAGTAIDDAIPYYGPLYLAALYAETTTVIVGNGGAISSSNAGGFGRELSSSMLVNDITNAIPGTTLVIDRRYNRQYLTNAEMMALVNKQTVSLRMQYNYNGVEYDILIPAGVGVNNILAYYGPLYLAAYYR